MDAKELKEKIDLVVTDYNTKTNNDTEYAIVTVMNEINDLIEENGAFYKMYGAEKPLIYDLFYLNSILKFNKTRTDKVSLTNTYFDEEIYKVSMNQNIFNFLPKSKISNIDKVNIKSYDSSDKSFKDLVSNFSSKDDLRPFMQVTNFNSLGIVSTDAHKLLFLSKKDNKLEKDENKCISDFCLKHQEKFPSSFENIKYPNWRAVIPQKDVNPFDIIVDTDNLRMYLQICFNFGFFLKNYSELVVDFRFKKEENSEYIFYRFNLGFLIECVEALLKLGIKKTKIHFGVKSRGIVFTDDENKEIDFINQNFILLMPMISDESSIFMFDFESNSVLYADKKYEFPFAIESGTGKELIKITDIAPKKEKQLVQKEKEEKEEILAPKKETPAEIKVDNDVFDVTKLDLNNSISSRVYYRGVDNEINKISKNDYKPKYDFDKKGVEWVYKNTRYNVKDEDLILELKEALAEKNRGAVDIMRINNELPRIESKYGKDVNLAKRMYQEAKDFYENKLRTEKSIRANDVFIDYLISRLKESKKEETPAETKSINKDISNLNEIKIGMEFYYYFDEVKHKVTSIDDEYVYHVEIDKPNDYQFQRMTKVDDFKKLIDNQEEYKKEVEDSIEKHKKSDDKLKEEKELEEREIKFWKEKVSPFSSTPMSLQKNIDTLKKSIIFNSKFYFLYEHIENIYNKNKDKEPIFRDKEYVTFDNKTFTPLFYVTGYNYLKYLFDNKPIEELKKETPAESKSDLEYLNELLVTSKDLLDLISDTGSKSDIDFLKAKIEATENLISLLQ
jgi:hypothetical protein